ncbi:Glycosyltransferase-like protein LARGE [Schistosoma japonicum]|nr:Glycosyltransferase-like protein LARGE [Schistosoma japonicum]
MKILRLKKESSNFKSKGFFIVFTGSILTVLTYLLSVTLLSKDIKNTKNLQKVQKKRFHCRNNRCCLADLCKRRVVGNLQCSPKKASEANGPITFHFLADKRTRLKFQRRERSWNLINVKFQFYEYQHYLNKLHWITSKHSTDVRSCLKLLLPEILPRYVRQVIVLDIFLLLNADINELWNHFKYFKSTQILGLTVEQNPNFEIVMRGLIKNWRGHGYNTGVMLMDLAKLRSVPWNHIWMSAAKYVMKTLGYLTGGEQRLIPLTKFVIYNLFEDVINLITLRNNEVFYEIPCEWNIQLNSGVDIHRCPVSWTPENNLLNNRDLLDRKQPKIVHMDHQVKPEDLNLENILSIDTNTSLMIYNSK